VSVYILSWCEKYGVGCGNGKCTMNWMGFFLWTGLQRDTSYICPSIWQCGISSHYCIFWFDHEPIERHQWDILMGSLARYINYQILPRYPQKITSTLMWAAHQMKKNANARWQILVVSFFSHLCAAPYKSQLAIFMERSLLGSDSLWQLSEEPIGKLNK